MMLDREGVTLALADLEQAFPKVSCALEHEDAFTLLVATMLSAQCTDKQVNRVTSALFEKYPHPKDFAALTPTELEPLIKSCGFYHDKARNIIAACIALVTRFNGEVPSTMEELVSLPGVGRKTANVVLSNAFNVPAIAVDTHVFRVSNRIGLAQAKDVEKTEKQLMENIPKELWSVSHHRLIALGRQICSARNPKCGVCALREVCSYNAVLR